MPYRALLLLPALAGVLAAQTGQRPIPPTTTQTPLPSAQAYLSRTGTTPKPSAQDYPARAKLENLSIGAEYLIHSFSSGRQMFIAKDYLVVEVGIYPANGQSLPVNAGDFTLRINGRKEALSPQDPEIVANTLKYPDPNTGGLHPMAQLGPLVLGAPRPAERFPGDPDARSGPVPRTPDDNTNGVDKEPPVKAEELVVEAALPEGEQRGPASGFLYFPYRGKIGHIHALDLVFTSPAGAATLPLPLD
jgi:hypothetical protein